MKKMISVIVPVFNEAEGIKQFLDDKLLPELQSLNYKTELVIIDDGSSDKTLEKIHASKINRELPVKIIAFSKNFGKEVALSAGLEHASGDAAIMIDADGQHPVEEIPKMLEKWEGGADIVTAIRGHNTTKHKLGSRIFYRIMKISGNNVVPGAMDFRLIDRAVIDEFNKFTEHNRLARGLIDWLLDFGRNTFV